jgi:hypothetical protein
MTRTRALAPLLLLASSCAAGECDPARAGFVSGLGCEMGGGYARRAAAQEQQLAGARNHASAARARAEAEARRAEADQAELASRRQRLAALDRDIAALERRLVQARVEAGANRAALREAEDSLDALRRTRAAVPAEPDQENLAELERQRRDLAAMLTRL